MKKILICIISFNLFYASTSSAEISYGTAKESVQFINNIMRGLLNKSTGKKIGSVTVPRRYDFGGMSTYSTDFEYEFVLRFDSYGENSICIGVVHYFSTKKIETKKINCSRTNLNKFNYEG